jgi:molybdopterin molybdotransferase
VDGFGIHYDAIEVKDNRFNHAKSVGVLRVVSKTIGEIRQSAVMPYYVWMPDTQPTRRLPSYDEALGEVLRRVSCLGDEFVPLGGALDRVLCRDIIADRDQPPFDRSAMDGYAVRSSEVLAGASHEIIATIPAGAAVDPSSNLGGGVARIATGASVPGVYDAVIPVEQAREDQAGQRVSFSIDQVKPGACIHPRGADAKTGQVLIASRTMLGPRHVGIAASTGTVQVPVIRKPSVSLITTGDEVRPPATPTDGLAPHQIRNSNGPMMDAFLRGLGVELMDHVHVVDDPQATLAAAQEALGKSDLVVTVGGISAGRRDYLPGVWDELGLQTVLKGVAIQPGKPVFVAQPTDNQKRLVVGLPGNPVSVLATAHLFVWPIIRAMVGLPPALPWRRVWLSGQAQPNPRREVFRSARLIGDTLDQVEVIHWHGSGDLVHTSHAAGFIRLAAQEEPLQPGTAVRFLPMIGGAL